MTSNYLSPEWFEEARSSLIAASLSGDAGDRIRFGYTITSVPEGVNTPAARSDEDTVRYGIILDPPSGTATIEVGSGDGDIRFTMTYAVAHSVASGAQNGSKAFLNGEVQLGGNVDLLIQRARDLAALDGLLPPAPRSNSLTGADRKPN